ncbi:MAG: 30S ribosomal protein S15 [Bdellovibrio sp. CG12_big_fil_rev_8_21_14_0_65_39_13]|nr:MAG: 30S ribosomal protein S15 [Bdellovibrio sp. CG22_combo_CG10-13_8_21_14_all_39_27]PIQ59522.1 MAG: 30S ribosomal protein S15 [Bdellovibrio sp. CG12_big_fil_rev_8_21_14_0_65_39_13]PIR33473.1 MAG: 30S ribosomal protein S15 [Bdellovibrio sp. CG11_big_fil_rev_8_21_14_0_20_39_38]PJB52254.1 MAG: 30S ribosomal protein S15 [Bdellovibrio sp. CG_4_9_14_3_um_filter_39_7]
MLTTEQRKEIVTKIGTKFGKGPNDTGSSSVQVALLTARINDLMTHFAKNKKDHHSNRGLLKMIGSRRSLLRYIQNNDKQKYQDLIAELGLRK